MLSIAARKSGYHEVRLSVDRPAMPQKEAFGSAYISKGSADEAD